MLVTSPSKPDPLFEQTAGKYHGCEWCHSLMAHTVVRRHPLLNSPTLVWWVIAENCAPSVQISSNEWTIPKECFWGGVTKVAEIESEAKVWML